ncbi:uncharacterized protein B0I36DRAFT_331142 [Microdochium trichocladiopsis]|uniref:SET domain-containing protein n=1 Tax=Microdochium trichocladiopsis TaxID=1682393 RepID=A0A9P9BMW0_9PEZI|nr:uncharacterized protein B0I36DRAFT_331142 [Microdochium trichocladiopsis]KAH7026680.1 hypothetical protein B0I36DRAFT_331142 [Microdochium trichocladiopsis]
MSSGHAGCPFSFPSAKPQLPTASETMTALQNLLDWAKSTGVQLDGIAPQPLPGRGIGVVASRDLKKGDIVLDVPTTAIHCLDTVPTSLRQRLAQAARDSTSPRLSLHGLLAAALLLNGRHDTPPSDESPGFDSTVWARCAPSMELFKEGFPQLWPPLLQALVPQTVATIIETQRNKIHDDWTALRDLLTSTNTTYPFLAVSATSTKDQFVHAWLLINSRTFYNLVDSTRRYPYDERLALIPLADLFNHTPSPGTINKPRKAPVAVSFSTDGYTFTATKDIVAGEEVCISYGEHSNDILLAEYGFFFTSSSISQEHNGGNPYDSISLAEVISPLLTADQQTQIVQAHRSINIDRDDDANSDRADETANPIDGCTLSVDTTGAAVQVMLSPMLQIALRIVLEQKLTAEMATFGTSVAWVPCPDDRDVVLWVRKTVQAMQVVAQERLESLRVIVVDPDAASAKELLTGRWRQIQRTAALANQALQSHLE